MPTTTSPYLLPEPPTSTGKSLLSRAFDHWCTLHHGYSSLEIATAFDDASAADPAIVRDVRHGARLIGELIAAGRLRTYSRPIGAGRPEPVAAEDWELDDFMGRFARSAFDPSRPFDADAPPTHWIFVDLEDFNALIEDSCADVRPFERAAKAIRQIEPATKPGEPATTGARSSDDDHVRLPEVIKRTGMSRSTIYRRIDQGRFPTQIEMDGNIAAWRECELAEWLANPR